MSGILYLVGTPIGNLGDITYRAVETMKNVDVIACEDTRHTLVLLNELSIKKPLMSYYKQKEKKGSKKILQLLEEGKNVALVSDAGMPCVSDPGAVVVQVAREYGFSVTVVPGPNAAVSAIALCGIETGFTFIGFLPEKKKDRDGLLSDYLSAPLPLVFYVAPHDLEKTINNLYDVLGARKYFAVKEITKIYEGVFQGELGAEEKPEAKGEYVLIVMPNEKKEATDEEIVAELKKQIESGSDKKTAVFITAKALSVSENRTYKLALRL